MVDKIEDVILINKTQLCSAAAPALSSSIASAFCLQFAVRGRQCPLVVVHHRVKVSLLIPTADGGRRGGPTWNFARGDDDDNEGWQRGTSPDACNA